MIEAAESGEPGGIPAEKAGVLVLLEDVAETGDIGAGRAAAVRGRIFKTVVFGGNMYSNVSFVLASMILTPVARFFLSS
ncbi:hypothetical protein [Puia dinghuensis]|uniref:hypothetical protein n=1 Tax=Puia dinghuensis TaxID=1792502 RepID=UPI001E46399D|nr:hypothetical protein [Puia dinghuensis]